MEEKVVKVWGARIYIEEENKDETFLCRLTEVQRYDLDILKDQIKTGKGFKPVNVSEYIYVRKEGEPFLFLNKDKKIEILGSWLEPKRYLLGLETNQIALASKAELVIKDGEIYAVFKEPLNIVSTILSFAPEWGLLVFKHKTDGFNFLEIKEDLEIVDWFDISFKLKKNFTKWEEIVHFISKALEISNIVSLKTISIVEIWVSPALLKFPFFTSLKKMEKRYINLKFSEIDNDTKRAIFEKKREFVKLRKYKKEIFDSKELLSKIFDFLPLNLENLENSIE